MSLTVKSFRTPIAIGSTTATAARTRLRKAPNINVAKARTSTLRRLAKMAPGQIRGWNRVANDKAKRSIDRAGARLRAVYWEKLKNDCVTQLLRRYRSR
jgi:hypothetical protein